LDKQKEKSNEAKEISELLDNLKEENSISSIQ
jgi:hypothetical protein